LHELNLPVVDHGYHYAALLEVSYSGALYRFDVELEREPVAQVKCTEKGVNTRQILYSDECICLSVYLSISQ